MGSVIVPLLLTDNIKLLISNANEYPKDEMLLKLREELSKIVFASRFVNNQETEVVTLSSSKISNFVRIDERRLQFNLLKIDWVNLCDDYDLHHFNEALASTSQSTALDLVLECFECPLVFPPACDSTILIVLLETCCAYRRSRSVTSTGINAVNGTTQQPISNQSTFLASSSQSRLQSFISKQLLQRSPLLISKTFWKSIQGANFFNFVDAPYKGENTLHVLGLWYKDFPCHRFILLTMLSRILTTLDKAEQSLLDTRECKMDDSVKAKKIACRENRTNSLGNRKRTRKHSGSLPLLDEQLDVHFSSFSVNQIFFHQNERSINHRDVMQHSDSSTDVTTTANQILDFWKIKAKYIQTLLQHSRRLESSWKVQKPVPYSFEPVRATFYELLDILCTDPGSPSLRLLIALLAGSFYKNCSIKNQYGPCYDGYDLFIHAVWSKISDATEYSKYMIYLNIFMEFISSCSVYNNPEKLFSAISPFLRTIQKMLTKFKSNILMYPLVVSRMLGRCFAYLLFCRGEMMIAAAPTTITRLESTAEKSQESMSVLSLVFLDIWEGHSCNKYWIDSFTEPSTPERYYLLNSLEKSGFHVATIERESPMNSYFESSLSEQNCFIKFDRTESTIVRTLKMIGPWLDPFTKELTKAINFLENDDETCEASKKARVMREEHHLVKLCDINDDVLIHIFSFLNYKRLVRMRHVCSHWATIADIQSLWQGLYIYRFKPTSDEMKISKNDQPLTWKKLFIDRWQAERDIRQFVCMNKSFRNVRLCNYINCLEILRNPNSTRRHLQKHHPMI